MTNWLHKKILPLLLSLTFSVVGFGVFVDTAHAGIKNDIIKDLSIPLTESDLPYINEIPRDITPDQAANILNTIETDLGVVSALNEFRIAAAATDVAQNTYDAAVAAAKLSLSGGVCMIPASTECKTTVTPMVSTEKNELDKAKADMDVLTAELGKNLVIARNSKNELITQLQELNKLANLASSVISELGTTTASVSADYSETAGRDEVGAEPPTINPADIPIKDSSAAMWLDKKDEVAVRMHNTCKIISLSPNVMPCFAEITYYVIYKPVSFALYGSGVIFDTVLMLSIDNSKKMVVPRFIDSAWTVVRDFSNMLFIFILLYTGIMTMFGAAEWRRVVLQVVIVALLINFSLFFTKVIIDAGNVFAVGIKSAISTDSISAGLVDAFKPQKFLMIATSADIGNAEALNAIIVFLIASAVTGYAAYVFFKMALLFMGRLIAFWILMIVSPFAFISTAMPMGNIFSKWFHMLLAQAFVAPLFLFFVYLIMMVIQSGDGILTSFSTEGTGWFNSLLGPVIVAIILCYALDQALKFTTTMAGSFGKIGSQMVSAVLTTASIGARVGVAVASGGTSLIAEGAKFAAKGGSVMGMDFKGLAKEGGTWDKWGAGMNKFKESKWGGRVTSAAGTTGSFLKESSFDVRNIGGDTSVFGHVAGGVIKQGVGALGIGKGVGEGGVSATQAKQAKINAEQAKKKEDKILAAATAAQPTAAEIADIHKREMRNEAERMNKARDAQKAAEAEKEAAEKAHNESATAKIVESIQKGFEKASKAGRAVEAKKLAAELKIAKEAHATSATGIRLATAKEVLEVARKESTDAQEHTATIIKDEKDRRTNVHARKAEAKGRYDTAAKIRKGEKGGKKPIKDVLTDLLKEAGEITKPEEAPAEPKH